MKLKPLLTSLLLAPLLGVSSIASADLYYEDLRWFPSTDTSAVTYFTVDSQPPNLNPSWNQISDVLCSAIQSAIRSYADDVVSSSDEFHSYGAIDATGNQRSCYVTYRNYNFSPSRSRNVMFRVRYSITDEPPEPTEPDPCVEGMTNEACCDDTAEQACMAYGGVNEFFWYPQDSIGGERCEYTCNDDVDEPDPDPEPEPDPDPDPQPDPTEPELDPTPEPEPEPPVVPEPPSDATDTQLLAYYLDILARQAKYDSRVYPALLQLRADNNFNLRELRELTAQTNQHLESQGLTLEEIRDALAPPEDSGLGLPVISSELDESHGVPGVNVDNPFSIHNYDPMHDRVRGIMDELGLDSSDLDMNEFELDRFDISERFGDFQPFLPPSECPRSRTYDVNGLSFSMNFSPLCDVFGWIGYLVLASAWFSTPFIVFGASKK